MTMRFLMVLISISVLLCCKTRASESSSSKFLDSGDGLNPELYPDFSPHSDAVQPIPQGKQIGSEKQNQGLGLVGLSLSVATNETNCPGLTKAISIFNGMARDKTGKCWQWFNAHGTPDGSFYIAVHSFKATCLLSNIPTWTYPWVSGIGFCRSSCDQEPTYLASLIAHEVAHHFCPQVFGRESCAIQAQNACVP
jgi:hypothetical protein